MKKHKERHGQKDIKLCHLLLQCFATSNVPVWAAEFSDGSDAAVATEAPAAETFSR